MIHWPLPSDEALGVLAPRENHRNCFGKIPLHAPHRRPARRPRAAGRRRARARGRRLGRGREDHQAQQEGGRRVREPELRPGAQDPEDRARRLSRRRARQSQVAARTHVHLGVVLFAGFKQKDEAVAEFKKALEMAPDVKLDKLLATPEIQEVFDQAVSEQKGEGGGGERRRRRGRRHHARAGDGRRARQVDPDQHDARFVGQGEEGRPVVQRRRLRGFRRARDAGSSRPATGWARSPPRRPRGPRSRTTSRSTGTKTRCWRPRVRRRAPGRGAARRGRRQAEGAAATAQGERVRRADLVLRARRRQRVRLDDGAGGDQQGEHHVGGEKWDPTSPWRQGQTGWVRRARLGQIAPEVGYFLSPCCSRCRSASSW